MGDKQLFIFDIDSALDKLEDDLISSEIKNNLTTISTPQSQQQKIHNDEEISTRLSDEMANDAVENNENDVRETSKKETLSELSLDDSIATQSKFLSPQKSDEEKEVKSDDESKPNDSQHTQINERSDFLENSITIDDRTTAATLTSSKFEINSSTSITSTNSDRESDSEDIIDEVKTSDQVPMISEESTSKYRDVTLETTDDSSKRLINSDESNQNDEEDMNVTTDLTLTKTVEPTEYDPDPEPNEPQMEEQNNDVIEEDKPEDLPKAVIEEKFDIKEISHNFESTMDDISDAELESLEQELDDLISAAANAVNSDEDEVAVKSLEESVEKTVGESLKDKIAEEVPKSTEVCENVEEISKETAANQEVNFEKESEEISKENESESKIEEIPKELLEISNKIQEFSDIPQEIHQDISIDEQPSVIENEIPESISEALEAEEPQQNPSNVDADAEAALSTSSTDESASIQNLPSQSNDDYSINESVSTGSLTSQPLLGHVPPHWIPDSSSQACMQCDQKFTLVRRRHHCRACGLLLCSSCCSVKYFLVYLQSEGRICERCHVILKMQAENQPQQASHPSPTNPSSYCSTIPVQQQVNANQQPPTVMVPSGVLKRTGSRGASERKSVMFSDGIRPGTDLDDTSPAPSTIQTPTPRETTEKPKLNFPKINEKSNSYIPEAANELPPILFKHCEFKYVDNNLKLLHRMRQEELKFAINKNFYVIVKIVTLSCCTNKTVFNFSTSGLLTVRQDEIMILLELNDDMITLPKEVFLHLNEIYSRADKSADVIKEYGCSQASSNNFLGAFGGFLYIKPTFQCLQSLTLPDSPYLIGLLVHKWEVPWMKLFPLRLILRLGALYRYYPTPILSNINREPVFAEIGNTIMNFLVDFRNFSYTIEIIKGLNIQMEVRKTSVFIPRNRYDQIMKVINNSTDHLLAFGADFSKKADGHLVCMQNIDSSSTESLTYSTQMINIQGQERIRTGASFLILNGALKPIQGLKAKCSIVEDGLMIQIFPAKMQSVREALKGMKNVEIPCGPIDDDQKESEEIISIEWVDDDLNFNVGAVSPIDNLSFEGKESIRMRLDISSHNHTKVLRWCEVFLLESDEAPVMDDHLNYSKLCEPIAKACGNALLPFLDLMAVNQLRKIGIRVTLGENIKYLAGSNGLLFSPIYMNALDNELIAVIHRQASNMTRDSNMTLELIFYILSK